jgi:TAT (twin-arginine translocation) pathway signal sequence
LTTRPISRRQFLQAGAAGAIALALPPRRAYAAPAASGSTLEIVSSGFPRAFVFRQSEVLANLRSYEEWEAGFLPLEGILGKVLQEERTDTVTARNAAYFAEFKSRNPGKLVLAHVNGQACLADFVGAGWWPGFWLYRVGATLTAPLSSADGSATVSDPSQFSLNRDVFGDQWADLAISSVDEGGHPDFAAFEYVHLTAVDMTSSTLTIARGEHGTPPTDFAAGSYIAQIANGGRWSAGDDYVLMYNLSTVAPRAPDGRTAIDALVGILANRMTGSGDLAAIDGIELDAFSLSPDTRAGVDANLDTIRDDGIVDGVDTYELGAMEYVRRLREMLGTGRILLHDGGKLQRSSTQLVNGIEEEGFPSTTDYDIEGWSEALNILAFWNVNGGVPQVQYPMFKFRYPLAQPVSFPRFRLALAAALFTDSAFTFYDEPGGGSLIGIAPGTPDSGQFPNRFTIWDELVAGRNNKPSWLGQPAGLALHLAEQGDDLLGGEGAAVSNSFIASLSGKGVRFRRRGPSSAPYLLALASGGAQSIAFDWTGVQCPSNDLVLAFDVRADALADYPPGVPRRLQIIAFSDHLSEGFEQTVLVGASWFHVVLSFRDAGPGAVRFSFSIDGGEALRLRAMRAHVGPDATCRLFRHGAVFANPSSTPYSFDLATLAPGRRFKRLRATAGQDPQTNDGSAIGDTLGLSPLDALMVIQA